MVIRILFVCHGNICRSPMAEMVLKHLVRERHLEGYVIDSAAVSREELGHGIYPPAKRELAARGIPCGEHHARQIRAEEYEDWDHIIAMDMSNIQRLLRMLGADPAHKVHRLMDFTGHPADVDDPWYTDRFDLCYDDILKGCEALLAYVEAER